MATTPVHPRLAATIRRIAAPHPDPLDELTMAPAIHFPALHLTEAMLNRLIAASKRHTNVPQTQAMDLFLGHITALHRDLEELQDALDGSRFPQIDPDGVTFPRYASQA